MAFEVFERPRRSRLSASGRSTVSISRNGRLMMFNARAARMLEGFDHALLMFDDEARRMAIRPSDGPDPQAYRVNHVPSAANISCAAFSRYYRLPLGVAWELTHENGMYCATVG